MAISDDALYDSFSASQDMFGSPTLRRVDLPAGATRWTLPWDSRGSNGLSIFNNRLINFFENEVRQYSTLDGTPVATAEMGIYPIYSDVLIQDQTVVARSQNLLHPEKEGVQTFDLRDLTQKWFVEISYRHQKGSNAFWGDLPSIYVTPDSIYLFDKQDNLLRLDLQTGNTIWSTASPGPQAMSRPVVMNDQVYALFADGTVRSFSEEDGAPKGVVVRTPIWYRKDTDNKAFRDLVGGLGVAGDKLIVTTGCRNVFAIQLQ
jgi:outer membrane protein assembly factor BamB